LSLTAEEIAARPDILAAIRRQSVAMNAAYDGNPRLSWVFATQQRWLMAHLGVSLHFRRDPAVPRHCLTVTRFLDEVKRHRIASVNTADAFAKEMIKYGIIEQLPSGSDRRVRELVPSREGLDALTGWLALHLDTLDGFDGGSRAARFAAEPESLARIQPLIADGLLTLDAVRVPAKTFSLFTWLDKGGVVMDRMIAGMGEIVPGAERVSTSVMSVYEMAEWLQLSRTHLSRKLHEAEALGSIGWEGRRFHSTMWVSADFLREMVMAQAVKLAVIDAAFEAACDGVG